MPSLTLEDSRFVWRGDYADRTLPKDAGFRWDGTAKVWWTDDERRASKLSRFAHGKAREILAGHIETTTTALAQSRATDAAVQLPVPEGLSYLPYQKAGITYGMDREGCLIADEMGLGKTIQAIGIANATGACRVLIICPASLRLNWQREFDKWKVNPLRVGVCIADEWPEDCDVIVINYDIVERHRARIDAIEWDLLVCDEAHYLKNPKAQRTAAVLGGEIVRKKSKPTKK